MSSPHNPVGTRGPTIGPSAPRDLVSACGLFCGACHKFKRKSCPGCEKNDKATWCKIRLCTRENGYATCAECTHHEKISDCKKFNTLFAKLFALVFRSDRKASLARISQIGLEAYAQEMRKKDQVVIKR